MKAPHFFRIGAVTAAAHAPPACPARAIPAEPFLLAFQLKWESPALCTASRGWSRQNGLASRARISHNQSERNLSALLAPFAATRSGILLMSMLGKVLACLNVLVAIALAVLVALDYGKRQAWAYSVFRHDLAVKGIPLNPEELGPD